MLMSTTHPRLARALRPRAAPLILVALALGFGSAAQAQSADPPSQERSDGRSIAAFGKFLGGAAVGLGAHEGGHLLFDAIFDAKPRVKKVDFGGIPFFAITHRSDLSPRRELTIASAGFWMQHAASEVVLTGRPRLREERAPFAKGWLAFNVLASMAYGAAALGHAGPYERDSRAMAASLKMDERWVGVIVLAPAVLDAYRYFHPDAGWSRWGSRAAKIGIVLLVVK